MSSKICNGKSSIIRGRSIHPPYRNRRKARRFDSCRSLISLIRKLRMREDLKVLCKSSLADKLLKVSSERLRLANCTHFENFDRIDFTIVTASALCHFRFARSCISSSIRHKLPRISITRKEPLLRAHAYSPSGPSVRRLMLRRKLRS